MVDAGLKPTESVGDEAPDAVEASEGEASSGVGSLPWSAMRLGRSTHGSGTRISPSCQA